MTFMGGDNLTGFRKLLNDMYMQNELRNGQGAYEISHAKKGNSGYSFGPMQWDLASENSTALPLFRNILTNATDKNGIAIINSDARNDIMDQVANRQESLSKDQRHDINAALSSDYGMQKINEAYLLEIEAKVNYIDSVINAIDNPNYKSIVQNNDFFKLFIADVKNQFGDEVNADLVSYLDGETVTLPNGGKTVSISGELGIEDLMQFQLSTGYANDHAADLLRRFSNIIETVGVDNVQITDELTGFLKNIRSVISEKVYKRVINNKDNWGLVGILKKPGQFSQFQPMYDAFNDAQGADPPRWYDPLIIDLDGDGIETVASTDGAFFDHDGNGFAELTGWVAADDGLLVRDINGSKDFLFLRFDNTFEFCQRCDTEVNIPRFT